MCDKYVSDKISEIEFTKCTLEKGDPDQIVEEGEWFEIELKPLFDKNVFGIYSFDLEHLLGFKLDTIVRQRLGYFDTLLGEILHKAIYQMKLNELVHLSFEIDPNLLDESLKRLKFAEHETKTVYLDLKFEIKLIKIEKANQISVYRMSEQKLLNLCLEHKLDANALFKKGQIIAAFKRYFKSMSYLIIAEQLLNEKLEKKDLNESLTIDENSEFQDYRNKLEDLRLNLAETKAQLYSNFALCQMKSQNYEMARKNCAKCLELQPNNVKALFRRGQALVGLNEYEEAISDFSAALKIEPENRDIQLHLENVEQLKKNYESQMSSRFKKLFS